MLKAAEKTFTVAMLFYLSGAVFSLFMGTSNGVARLGGNHLALAVQVAFYAAAFFFIALSWRDFVSAAWGMKWIVALSLLAMASCVWSQDPAFTLRRSLVLLATTAFGVYFGSRYSISEQLRLLAWACALMVVASFAFALVLPKMGIDHLVHAGDWQGAFVQKNTLARAMVLSTLVFYFVRPPAFGWIRWVGLAGSFALLGLSHSVTGAAVFATVLGILPLFAMMRKRASVVLPFAIVLGLVAAVAVPMAVAYRSELLVMLNRSPTLTDRTELWHAVVRAISMRPYCGYGFNTFWMGMQGASAEVMLQVGWFPKHSHNGFLDLMLDLGVVGLGTFVAGYLSLWRKALGMLRSVTGSQPVWICTYLAFMFAYNLTESSILSQNNLFWILYVAGAATLATQYQAKSLSSEAVSSYGYQADDYCLQG